MTDNLHTHVPFTHNWATLCIACRYGAVPVVRKTGGLADTVRDVESHQNGEGNGYTFEGSDEGSLYSALDRALAHFTNNRESWQQLSLCNMNTGGVLLVI